MVGAPGPGPLPLSSQWFPTAVTSIPKVPPPNVRSLCPAGQTSERECVY